MAQTKEERQMLFGAIIGDIVGSRFEWHNIKTKQFELFTDRCDFTDDTVETVAVADALIKAKKNSSDLSTETIKSLVHFCNAFTGRGYGDLFVHWVAPDNPHLPYNSYSNGAAMRVSPVGWVVQNLDDIPHLVHAVTAVSHNHPDALHGAEAVCAAIFLARTGKTMDEIKSYIHEKYYDINFTLADIRPNYEYDVSCKGTVPPALQCFFESTSFEDAIRNAISIGGDSDTLGAITGSIAEAYYGIPENIIEQAKGYLYWDLYDVIVEFESLFGNKKD